MVMERKFACADFSFPLLSHDQALDVIAILGFQGADIGLFGGRSHLRPEDVLEDIHNSARNLVSKLDKRNLKLADIFFIAAQDFQTLAANHPDRRERRKSRDFYLRILEFALRCNARHLSGLPGTEWEGESFESSLERCSEELAWRVEQAHQAGISFSVEAHLGSLVPTPSKVSQLVRMTPGLTLTLDYGHFTYQGIPDAEVEPLLVHASHFHARCACKSRLQSSFKHNTIDYTRILREMKRVNYSGCIGVEYVWIDWEHCNEVDNLSETILLRDFLKAVDL